ncbi:AraC family transcriptional regulator [Clostridium sp. ZBS2]|uniref:helix-turn-helix domain-containing protein n=1 Tax=Clostridium sp. ZBS2 TaxID=2949976 RepID=UPI0020792E3B|nr:AraC family transcriptional regulator [Clostridium sp. ZBS2]
MYEYKDSSWKALADKYNLTKRPYGKGQIYDFPHHWSNGWIAEINPAKGLFVSSAWLTPSEQIVHTINSSDPFMLLFCIDCGEIVYSQQGKKKQALSPITHLIINPQKQFTFTFSKDVHYCFTSVLIFDDFIKPFLKDRTNAPKISVEDAKLWKTQHYNTPDIMLILEQIRWAVRNTDMPLLAFEGMTLHLLSAITRNFPDIPKIRSSRRHYVTWENEQKIYEVKTKIDEDILNPPAIIELCRIAEMSESKLRESFKNHYGIPLYKYIRIETMKRAMQLLSADHLSIRNISELCGYKNPAKFAAAFKDVHGITPSYFRKSFNL